MKKKSGVRKLITAIVIILCLGGIAAYLVLGRGLFLKKAAVVEPVKTYTVASGNLTTMISAAGNLALTETENAAVNIFYPAGTKATIGEVMAAVGDTVTKGEVLVTIDKSEWNNQLQTLQDAIATKERAVLQAQYNVKTAQQAVDSSNNSIAPKQTAVKSAELAVSDAQSAFDSAIISDDFAALTAALRAAQSRYEYVSVTLVVMGTMPQIDWDIAMERATADLQIAQTNYDNAVAGYSTPELTLKKKQLEIAKDNLAAAQQAVINAQEDVPLKEMSLTLSQGSLDDALKAVDDAKNNYNDALATSPEVIAPIDGFITVVNVSPGDEVLNGTVVMQIANPNKFKIELAVSENDIANVTVGGSAFVTVDSLGATLPAAVTYIAPTATIQSGVVNYTVRIELKDLTAPPSFGGAGGDGGVPSFGTPNPNAPDTSNTTTPPFGGQGPAAALANIKLRQGLSVTVNVITGEARSVLVVPYSAVTTLGRQKTVEVVKADGTTEKRSVTTGITDYNFIVITQGLSAGEQIVVSSAAAASAATPPQGLLFPGIGGGTRRGG